jgi:hypothetical protein
MSTCQPGAQPLCTGTPEVERKVEIEIHGLDLGKVALCQLSYIRMLRARRQTSSARRLAANCERATAAGRALEQCRHGSCSAALWAGCAPGCQAGCGLIGASGCPGGRQEAAKRNRGPVLADSGPLLPEWRWVRSVVAHLARFSALEAMPPKGGVDRDRLIRKRHARHRSGRWGGCCGVNGGARIHDRSCEGPSEIGVGVELRSVCRPVQPVARTCCFFDLLWLL